MDIRNIPSNKHEAGIYLEAQEVALNLLLTQIKELELETVSQVKGLILNEIDDIKGVLGK